jgi:peroxiredoxin
MRLRSGLFVLGLMASTAATAGVAIGDKFQPFTLKDAAGQDVNLASFKDKKALVLIFVATQCPVSNAYNERMEALAQGYGAKGVEIVGLNANKQESPEEIAEHARKHGLTFPILKDAGNVYADKYGAQVTPEAYVYDQGGILRYHGRIDDNRAGDNIQSRDLANALDAVLAGKTVPVAETKAFGCTIKRQ